MARRYDELFSEVIAFANLHEAWRKAAKGKRGSPTTASFEVDLSDQLISLQRELAERAWRPGAYHSFWIRDPKPRWVSAAPFRDRVVHHALCKVTEPLFERTFIGDSYANRRGKGTHAALDRAQFWMGRYRYVLQCDVRQFFASVDHTLLQSVLYRKIGDEAVRELIRLILRSGAGIHEADYQMVYFPGDDLFAVNRERGLPIGNLTSQLWANVYLNELDQFVKRRLRCVAYLRYVDDFLLFSDDKAELWGWKEAITGFLETLRLTLHQRSSTVYPVTQGVPFLGFRLFPAHRLLKRRNGVNFQRRLRRCQRAFVSGRLSYDAMTRMVQGWVAHAAHANTWGLRRSLLSRARDEPTR